MSPDRGPSTSTTASSLSPSLSLLRLLVVASLIHAWSQLQSFLPLLEVENYLISCAQRVHTGADDI